MSTTTAIARPTFISGKHSCLEKLSGIVSARFPVDFRREEGVLVDPGLISASLTRELSEQLSAVCNDKPARMLAVLAAAVDVVLFRYSWNEDLAIATCMPGPGGDQYQSNELLVIRNRIHSALSLRQLVREVQTSLAEALEDRLPYEESYDAMGSPLLPIAVTFSSPDDPRPGISESNEMHFAFVTRKGHIKLDLHYDPLLFRPETANGIAQSLKSAIAAILTAPDQAVSAIRLSPEPDSPAVLAPTRRYRKAAVNRIFEEQAQCDPEAVAWRSGEQSITYRELNERANQLARRLVQLGVHSDVPVGLLLERSLEWIVAMLAVVKAGGAYVPLDPSQPGLRLSQMMEDTGVGLVLSTRSIGRRPEMELVKVAWIEEEARVPGLGTHNLAIQSSDDALAYIIFTSGSTGRPKAIGVPHRAICRLVCDTDYVQIHPSDRIAQCSNISFDAATFEIWGALLNGASMMPVTTEVALSPAEFARQLAAGGATILFTTTALFNIMAENVPAAFRALRFVLFGGEAANPPAVRAVLDSDGPMHLLHVYGPTENTTFSSWYAVKEISKNAVTVPIGQAIANSGMYVLDPNLQYVPEGALGEIFVAGDGLARGYLRCPNLTAAAFLPNPCSGIGGDRLYRTGDLGRVVGGQVEFVGRLDDQVKIRGFRVEPGEIAAALKLHPAVVDSLVLPYRDRSGNLSFTAYVVLGRPAQTDSKELKDFLKNRLPDYMIPANITPLESFPLNANGKTDRAALLSQRLPVSSEQAEAAAPPMSPTEEILVQIWRELLGVPEIGLDEDFFDLGGHSLMATQFVVQVAHDLGAEIPLRLVFEEPTIRVLAEEVDRRRAAGVQPELPPIVAVPRPRQPERKL